MRPRMSCLLGTLSEHLPKAVVRERLFVLLRAAFSLLQCQYPTYHSCLSA